MAHERTLVALLTALLTGGAAAVHAFAANSHGPGTLPGAGIAATAVLQAVGAVLLVYRPGRAARHVAAAVAVINGGALLVGVLAHTTGMPGLPGLAERSGFDGQLVAVLCFETAATLGAAVLATGSARVLVPGVGLAVLLAAVPAAAARHEHTGQHPDATGHASADRAGATHAAPDAGHPADPGHAPDAARTRYAAFTAGMTPQQVTEALAGHERWLTAHLLASGRPGLSREAAADFSRRALRAVLESPEGNGGSGTQGASGTQGSVSGGHGHSGPAEWQPIPDQATRDKLAGQLTAARAAALALPTAADARRAGYILVAPNLPGLGSHWLNPGHLLDGGLDPAKPEVLLYAGNGPTAQVVGVSYLLFGPRDQAPDGFAGPNDAWHFHDELCLVARIAVPAPDRAACESVGGRVGGGFTGRQVWMMHAWVVPGWESPWGLFSGENPQLTLAVGREP